MLKQVTLTNEKLRGLFDSPFELVNHAIAIARHMIESGEGINDGMDKNPANRILNRMVKDREMEEKSKTLLQMDKKSL